MEVLSIAIHEAGHAVVASYLRLPFQYATILPKLINGCETGGHVKLGRPKFRQLSKKRGIDSWRQRSEEEISTAIRTWRYKDAISTMAARAAEESRSIEVSEDCYVGDERDLLQIAGQFGVYQSDYPAWRLKCLNEARRIVSLPHIRLAIMDVAFQLTCAMSERTKRVSSKTVRESLIYAKQFQAGALGHND